MPSAAGCARCGANLRLASVAINVQPPRAGHLSRYLAGWTRRWNYCQWRVLESFRNVSRYEAADASEWSIGQLARCAVPGWELFHQGRRGRGAAFLALYAGVMLSGLVLMGTTVGAMLVGSAFVIHFVACCDALGVRRQIVENPIRHLCVGAVLLFLAVYLPAGWLLSQFAVPLQVNGNVPPLVRGDVVWYRPTHRVATGDFIYYGRERTYLQGENFNYQLVGPEIGRVIATAGQIVSWKDSVVYVDQLATPWNWHFPPLAEDARAVEVPAGHVFVLPSQPLPPGVTLRQNDVRELTLVSVHRIHGSLIGRSYPFHRISFLE